MSGNRQMELHYINTGFPYTVTESFMDLFEGLTYGQIDCPFAAATNDFQENAYWRMYTGPQKYVPWGASYYGHVYDVDDLPPRMDGSRTVENPSVMNNREPAPLTTVHEGGSSSTITPSNNEECIRSYNDGSSSQLIWQDNVDPDNMTYEELLDLGEAVGSHSRGLSRELISLLPVSKYKSGSFFSRKSRGERCVICQMNYKRRERQITLPCKHVYHADCGAKWLSINKACPVCYTEVFGEKSGN